MWSKSLSLAFLTAVGTLAGCSSDNESSEQITSETAIHGISDMEVNENGGLSFAKPSLVGLDAATVNWTLSGEDADLFQLNGSNGTVSLAAQDFEQPKDADGDNVYRATLTAKDSSDNSASVDFSVTILDLSESSLGFYIDITSEQQLDEHANIVLKPEVGGETVAGLVWSISGPDAELFDINANSGLITAVAPNFEIPSDDNSDNIYQITLKLTEPAGSAIDQDLRIQILDVDEFALSPLPVTTTSLTDAGSYKLHPTAPYWSAIGLPANALDVLELTRGQQILSHGMAWSDATQNWLAHNPNWRWASEVELQAYVALFQNQSQDFLAFNNSKEPSEGFWQVFIPDGEGGVWLAAFDGSEVINIQQTELTQAEYTSASPLLVKDYDANLVAINPVERAQSWENAIVAGNSDVPVPDFNQEYFCEINDASQPGTFIYVAPNGSNESNGSIEAPFATLSHALDVAGSPAANVTIYLREGTYTESIVDRSIKGQENNCLTIAAYPNEKVVLSGAAQLADIQVGDWQAFYQGDNKTIFKTELNQAVWQMFVDGEQQMLARWPNANFEPASSENIGSVYGSYSWAEGELDTGSKGSGDNVGTRRNGVMINATSGSDLLVHYYDLASATDYKGEPLDVSGSIMVANTASFYTYSRMVKAVNDMEPSFLSIDANTGALNTYTDKSVAHQPGTNTFTYEPIQSGYKNKKHSYFLEAKLELLDQVGEWHYQVEDGRHYLYYMVEGNQAPTGQVQLRNSSYAFDLNDSEYFRIQGVEFFASTVNCDPCNQFIIEDNKFKFSPAHRRVLKQWGGHDAGYGGNQYIRLYSAMNKRTDSGIVFRNNEVTDSDIQTLIVSGGKSVVTNNLFERLDISSADTLGPHATVMIRDMANQEVDFSYNTMDVIGNSTMFVPEGGSLHAQFNNMVTGGFAQNDGASFQIRREQAKAVNISYNWAHDSEKYGIRFDAPFNTSGQVAEGGQFGLIHHNVVWNAKGIMVKGDDHRVYHNTAWNNHLVDMRVLEDDNGNEFYKNSRTLTSNNASESIAGDREAPKPIPGIVGNNFNGLNESEILQDQLVDIANYDFRPKTTGMLYDAGAEVNSPNSYAEYDETARAPLPQYSEASKVGEALDLGAYEMGASYYWIPGFRHQHASFPIPLDQQLDSSYKASPNTALMWRDGYKAKSHHLYLSQNKSAIEAIAVGAKSEANDAYLGEFEANKHNIFQSTTPLQQGTYYWRVDAENAAGVVKGPVWKFTVVNN